MSTVTVPAGAVITEAQSARNVPAFLDVLAWCEGTSTHKLTKNIGYDIIVGGTAPSLGVEIFTDYSEHPFLKTVRQPKYIGTFHGKRDFSTASGRYQITVDTWKSVRDRLKLPDFSALSQDLAAVELIREHHDAGGTALDYIAKAQLVHAVTLLHETWASLPGSTAGQGGKTIGEVLAKFQEFTALRAAAPRAV